MTKDFIKTLIAEYQNLIPTIELVDRNYQFEANLNYVLVGLRRAGKSYLLYQQMQRLIREGHNIKEFLYFNFEDDRINSLLLEDLDLIKTCYEEMYDCRPIFFLDEIQLIDKWEKFARRLADQKYRVYVTGSNAKMLSSEIATTLGGRYMVKEVFPFSFGEFLRFSKIDIRQPNVLYIENKAIQKVFDAYFRQGGLPEVLQVQDKRAWLSSLFNRIVFGDLITRYQIRNSFVLKILVRKLAESVKQPSSYTRLANVVSSVGKKISVDTVIDYVKYMEESWLILPFENISAKLNEKESNRKYYLTDNGIMNLFLTDPNTSLLENIVAINLRRYYGKEVYFYNSQIEVDFYVPDESLAVQVCYSLQDVETRDREFEALLKMSNRLNVNYLMAITKDEESEVEYHDKTIRIVPVWKWLLSLENQ
ncbi:MAG: ATP-binding protein [Bacteroidales bacterium]